MFKASFPLRRSVLMLSAAGAIGLAFAAHAVTPRSSADVAAELNRAGFAEVREIEYDDGLWEAEVRRANGRWGEVHVDPISGEVFDAQSARAQLDAAALIAALEAQGYTAINDLDREGATWGAEAVGADGQRVELRASGYDGRVLHSETEWDD
ncbi:MAG: PepSY domain-containing protein [Xanthomonadales bacterium]|nr:PepSY domain-containing protein [Xanthomonadales bacterium]